MVNPARALRAGTAWLAAALVLVTTGGCDSHGADDQPYVVSYSQAAQRLAGLDALEVTEQVRDFARLGLASQLGLRHDQLVDALYDTVPVRDPIYTGLVDQPTGPGRTLFDGNTLHVLVPDGDPHRARTIGEAIDEHRVDAGSDAPDTQVHRYRLAPERREVELIAEPVRPTAEVRAANGWHESRVDHPGGVADFLAATDHLSRLEVRGSEVWAGGWRWPDTPNAQETAQVTAEDVVVLQRSYQGGSLPGFSLDPQPVAGAADVRAVVPDLAPQIAEAVVSGNWAGTAYSSAAEVGSLVEGALYQENPDTRSPPGAGLPSNRTQLWALLNLLAGNPAYSVARYDGDLAGTEVGMSLFYVDLVAKRWATGSGTEVPTDAVPGFRPIPEEPTPESLCASQPRGESGRLWFGQSDGGFRVSKDSVDVGAQATHLFSRSNGASGTEVESSYSFADSLRSFDRYFQDIADWDVQFHRLHELMRWSGALDWLSSNGVQQLSVPSDGDVRRDLRFADWYAEHAELRERAPLELVTPPSAAGREAVVPTPSAATPNCGLLEITGGVSLADGYARGSDRFSGVDKLPPSMRRNGPADPAATHVDPATGSADVTYVTPETPGKAVEQLRTELWRGEDWSSARHTGRPTDSVPVAGAPFRDANPAREATVEIRSGDSEYFVHQRFEGIPGDTVRVSEPATSGVPKRTEISARSGQVDQLKVIAEHLEKSQTFDITQVPGWSYSYSLHGQEVHHFTGGGWFQIGSVSPALDGKAIQVRTPSGVVREVRVVVPEQLSPADLSSTRQLEEGSVSVGELADKVPIGANVYTDDVALLGSEPGTVLPEASSYWVNYVIVQPGGKEGTSGPSVGGGRTWSLSNWASFSGGSGSSSGGPPGGSSGSVGGDRPLSGWGRVLGWQTVVLVSVCSDEPQDAGEDQEEPAGCW